MLSLTTPQVFLDSERHGMTLHSHILLRAYYARRISGAYALRIGCKDAIVNVFPACVMMNLDSFLELPQVHPASDHQTTSIVFPGSTSPTNQTGCCNSAARF